MQAIAKKVKNIVLVKENSRVIMTALIQYGSTDHLLSLNTSISDEAPIAVVRVKSFISKKCLTWNILRLAAAALLLSAITLESNNLKDMPVARIGLISGGVLIAVCLFGCPIVLSIKRCVRREDPID